MTRPLLIPLSVAITCVLSFPAFSSQGDESEKEEESYYSQLTRAVVRLEEHQSLCTPGREWSLEWNAPVGSAFFVRDSFEGESRVFIVTARHVVEERADLFARVQMGPETQSQAVLALPRSLWVFHPGPALPGSLPIDVAVMQVTSRPFIKAFLNCPTGGKDGECGRNEKTNKPFENALVESPSVMEHAIFFGFPPGDVAKQSAEPFARSGVVAYTAPNPELKINNKPVVHDSVYFVDAPAFPGNSGGPVVREPLPLLRPGVQLWGLVTGSSRFGKDYAIVTRPEKIAETLAHARKTAKVNEDGWSNKPPSLPVRCTPDR